MKVIVLAAGLGNRLGTYTTDIPKALVTVAGKALIDHLLRFINHPAVSKITIVGGYQFDRLAAHIDSQRITTKPITLLENTRFTEGSILTLKTALPKMTDSFLLMNTDHIYPAAMLTHILSNVSGLTAICDFNRDLVADDMKIKLNAKKQIVAIDKKLTNFDGGYIGMTYCDKTMIPTYTTAIHTTIETDGTHVSVERVLANLAANAHPIAICDTSAFIWHEVDTPDDRAKAETALASGEHV